MRNNCIRKNLLILLLTLLLINLSCSVFAAKQIKIDLETAVTMALENNLDLKIAKVELARVSLEYQQNKASNLVNVSRYNDLEAEINLKSAQNTYQNTKYQVITDTIKQYTGLWLATYDLRVKTKQLEVRKRLVKEARAQYKIGNIGTTDLIEKENDYSDTKLALETATEDYQQYIRELKRSLDLGEEAELVLADLSSENSWQITEDQAVSTALKNSLELILKEKNLELAQIDAERAKISDAELDKKIKDKKVAAARLDKKNTGDELENSVREDYHDFKESIGKIALTKDIWDETQEEYKISKKQYDVGLLTRTEAIQYEVNMMEAEYEYLSAIANYYLAKQVLQQEMNLQSGVLEDGSAESK